MPLWRDSLAIGLSTFPEAFGMVAVEAAACGALPVSAGHSGMRTGYMDNVSIVSVAPEPALIFPVAVALAGIGAASRRTRKISATRMLQFPSR